MQTAADNDLDIVKAAIANGQSREEALAPMLTDEHFEKWLDKMSSELAAANNG